MKEHTVIGRDILSKSSKDIFKMASDIAYCHHERWDGSGYPQGLKGEEIPIMARITAVADVFDALSNDRVYKRKWNDDEVLDYFIKGEGTYFDPVIVKIFLNHFKEIFSIK